MTIYETIETAEQIAKWLKDLQRIRSYNSCVNCGRRHVCPNLPKKDELIRINCILWSSENI